MALVAIAEPYDEIRELIARVVAALGHEPVDAVDDGSPRACDADALIFEPADAGSLRLAQQLRAVRPDLPLVSVSIIRPTSELRALRPVAFVEKPFRLAELEHAIALATRPRL